MREENKDPLVSIIMATYNRSNVLQYSIKSVLNSDFQDWELLVIGDCCTDDTENVVFSFADKRIKFVNLEKNHGEQSQANNVGLKLSRGKYIAFLNHDDLWFPDHLTIAIKGIEEGDADLVYTLQAAMCEFEGLPNVLINYTPKYTPENSVPASSWLFKRTLYESIGDWTFYKNCTLVPSQDWLYRALQANKKLHLLPTLTVIGIQSGKRKNSYAHRVWEENEYYYMQICDTSDFREKLMTTFAIQYAMEKKYIPFSKSIKNIIKSVLLIFGISLKALRRLMAGNPKKDVDYFRKVRGLPPIK